MLEIRRGSNRATCQVCRKRIKANGIQVKMGSYRGNESAHLHCLLIRVAERVNELSDKEEIRPEGFEEMVLLTKGKDEITKALSKIKIHD